jgi:hypothetical protein
VKIQPHYVHMLPGIKTVIVLLAVNLAIASFCAQVCSTPQPVASHCPQHPHSGNTNCCDHSSKNAAMTLNVDCAAGLKSMPFHFMPQPNSSSLENPVSMTRRRFHPPDSLLRYVPIEPSTVLRV